MRIAVTGAAGQLGRAIARALGVEHDVRAWSKADVNVVDADAVADAVEATRPDAIVHAAGWTDVDGCERDPERARLIHEEGTRAVATAARRAQAHLVVVSTDFVFDGAKSTPYVEGDEPSPIQVYGATKLRAESIAREIAPRCTIVRTAWLFDPDAPAGFVAAVLERGRAGVPFPVVADQVGSPTRTSWLAARIGEIAETRTLGVLHRAEPVVESRASFARRMLRAHGLDPGLVEDAATASMPPRPAARPAYSALGSIRDLADPYAAHGDGCDC